MQKRFYINGLESGTPIPHRESFDINDLYRRAGARRGTNRLKALCHRHWTRPSVVGRFGTIGFGIYADLRDAPLAPATARPAGIPHPHSHECTGTPPALRKE